jgi:hypothetical protein
MIEVRFKSLRALHKSTRATVQYREQSNLMLQMIIEIKRKLRVAPPCFARGTVFIAPSCRDKPVLIRVG